MPSDCAIVVVSFIVVARGNAVVGDGERTSGVEIDSSVAWRRTRVGEALSSFDLNGDF